MSRLSSAFYIGTTAFCPSLEEPLRFPLLIRRRLVLVLAVAAFYLVGQLLTGTSLIVATLFAVAILFGLLSVFAGGGLKSAFGCLNAVLIGKFLLFGITVNFILLAPSDGTLRAPQTTALVMATGFLGLFVGTVVQSRLACRTDLSLNRPTSNSMVLSFGIVLFLSSYLAYFATSSSVPGESVQTGGWLGIERAFASLKSFAIVPPMLYFWRMKTRLWMTHPVILGLLAWSALVGIFSTGKQEAIEPLAFYVLVGFMRYGLRDIRLWGLVCAGLIYYSLIVFPYSQYVRHNGGREGTLTERADVTSGTFLRILSDRNFRPSKGERAKSAGYFGEPALSPFSRLAMVGEADRLVDATERQESFTGWETIGWGFKLLTPSFLFHDKPVYEAGNYLGHIVGELSPADTTTQVSYGIMANLYNAFSLTGVLIGTALFSAGFYYWIRIFLGEPRWDGLPTTSSLWFLWVVAMFQHRIVESSLSGMIACLSFPFVLYLLWLCAKWLSKFLPVSGRI
jgi:hypothetical protein